MKQPLYLLLISMATAIAVSAAEPMPKKWIDATAYVIPKETATEGEGYFSIIEGHNGRLYIGTHANAVNSWLVEFDPAAEKMRIAVDAHKAIGKDLKGFGAQSKIHTRNNTGKQTGKIYFGTKQGYPAEGEKREDYPGGYPMVYDPKTDATKVYPPLGVEHHDAWVEAVYVRNNPKGEHLEFWQHTLACRRWLVVRRNTVNHDILAVMPARERPEV